MEFTESKSVGLDILDVHAFILKAASHTSGTEAKPRRRTDSSLTSCAIISTGQQEVLLQETSEQKQKHEKYTRAVFKLRKD